jgi:hypothetical protein
LTTISCTVELSETGYIPMFRARICFSLILSSITSLSLNLLSPIKSRVFVSPSIQFDLVELVHLFECSNLQVQQALFKKTKQTERRSIVDRLKTQEMRKY